MSTTTTLQFTRPDQGEETARADLYGLLAALFAAPPTTAMLSAIAAAPGIGEGVLAEAWRALAEAARAALRDGGAEAVREEYERLFIGIGKPEVMLYGSYYLSGFLMEKPLVALRTDLARLGIERADNVVESEDHIASLCEVMRYLIAADELAPVTGSTEGEGPGEGTGEAHQSLPPASEQARLAAQKSFFGTHLQPWADALCNALAHHRQSNFYRAVAQLTRCYIDVEAQAFDIG